VKSVNFFEQIIKRARTDVKTIVLPEGTDVRVIRAAAFIQKSGIANIVLLGSKVEIEKLAEGVDISGVKIVDPENSSKFDDYAYAYYEMRKSKGVTFDQARRVMRNNLFYGVMVVKTGEADGMVAGAINSTANTLRPALQILKTAPDAKIVSSFFVMVVPDCEYGHDGIFVYADCGLVENPDAEELAEIAIASAKSFELFVKAEPKVALLSYSTYGSVKSELTEKVVKAALIAGEKTPNLKLDGELQVDAALVPAVGKLKAPGSRVAGNANVLVFPDLSSGNIAYKLTQRLAKAEAYGPITQGLSKPVNDLSRGCSEEDIIGVVAITCVQAQNTGL